MTNSALTRVFHRLCTFEMNTFICLLIVVSSTSLVYFNSLFNGFVYDDYYQVLNNAYITDISYLGKIFTTNLAGFSTEISTSYYRPMTHVLHMAVYYIFGLNPFGYHLLNVILHTSVSVLCFLLSVEFYKHTFGFERPEILRISLATAVLFSVSPIHTESVAWITGFTDLNFTLFFLLSLYLYVKHEEGNKVRYVLSVICFLLASLSKEPALCLPFFLVCYDVCIKKIPVTMTIAVRRYAAYVIAAGLYFMLRFNALGSFMPSKKAAHIDILQSLLNIFPLFVKYIGKLLFPVNLSVIYKYQPVASIFEFRFYSSVVIILLMALILFKVKNKLIFFSSLILAVPLLPALYIPAISGSGMFSERYTYLPSFGFTILFVVSFLRLGSSHQELKKPIIAGMVLLIIGYSIGTVERNEVWKNSMTLWSDAVNNVPDSAVSHKYYGYALYEQKEYDKAIVQFREAINLDPDDFESHLNLGTVYFMERWYVRAIAEYKQALTKHPNMANIHNNLGLAYIEIGSINDAIVEFEDAVKLDPGNPKYSMHLNSAVNLAKSSHNPK